VLNRLNVDKVSPGSLDYGDFSHIWIKASRAEIKLRQGTI